MIIYSTGVAFCGWCNVNDEKEIEREMNSKALETIE
jgi:hypothetical protein